MVATSHLASHSRSHYALRHSLPQPKNGDAAGFSNNLNTAFALSSNALTSLALTPQFASYSAVPGSPGGFALTVPPAVISASPSQISSASPTPSFSRAPPRISRTVTASRSVSPQTVTSSVAAVGDVSSSSGSNSNVQTAVIGGAVGGTIGGLVLIALIAVIVLVILNRNKHKNKRHADAAVSSANTAAVEVQATPSALTGSTLEPSNINVDVTNF